MKEGHLDRMSLNLERMRERNLIIIIYVHGRYLREKKREKKLIDAVLRRSLNYLLNNNNIFVIQNL